MSGHGILLMLSLAVSSATIAEPPPAAPATPPAGSHADASPPDDSLLEFLGSDDVEDARMWDYLMKKSRRPAPAPQPPAQEAAP